MTEFTAQDAIRPRWSPALRARAVRRFMLAGLIIMIGTGVAAVCLELLGRSLSPLWLTVGIVLPSLLAFAALFVVFAITSHALLGRLLARLAFVLFLGSLAGIAGAAWGASVLFGLVDRILAARPDPIAQTIFGGELTTDEIVLFFAASPDDPRGLEAPPALEVVAYLLWPFQFRILRDLILAFVILGFVSITASFAIWWERKVAGRIQSRLGPMRVGGWHGWAQGIADGLKLVQKEDIIPGRADGPVFRLAPYLVFIPVLTAFLALPFSDRWVLRDLEVGLVLVLGLLGIDVIGVILAGWASHNKWSMYGAMRVAAQMVSYEIPMGMALLLPVMAAGTLRPGAIGALQDGGFHTWLAFSSPFLFLAAGVYFVASLAACKRAPFDLPEAESELTGGFHTEYSGFRWAVFFFGEYAAMFVVCGLAVLLFLGAWHSPLPASWGESLAGGSWWQRGLYALLFSGPAWFIAKTYVLLFVHIWLRWTLPRIRIDQVMYACVQVMLPMTMLLLLGQMLWQLLVPPDGLAARLANAVCTLAGAAVVAAFVGTAAWGLLHRRRLVGPLAVDHLPGS